MVIYPKRQNGRIHFSTNKSCQNGVRAFSTKVIQTTKKINSCLSSLILRQSLSENWKMLLGNDILGEFSKGSLGREYFL